MNLRSNSDRLERAVGSVTECLDLHSLGHALCVGATSIAGVPWAAVVVDAATGARHEAARYESPSATGPRVTVPLSTRIDFRGPDGAPYALVVAGHVDETTRDALALLTDAAMATAERIDSEEGLRAHRTRLRMLGDQVSAMESMLTTRPTPRDESAVEFASAAALLTEREREILEPLLAGASNADIAHRFDLSIETVKTHVKRILRKMGAANRAELISRSG